MIGPDNDARMNMLNRSVADFRFKASSSKRAISSFESSLTGCASATTNALNV